MFVWLFLVDISSTPCIGMSSFVQLESALERFVRLQAHLILVCKQIWQMVLSATPAIPGPVVLSAVAASPGPVAPLSPLVPVAASVPMLLLLREKSSTPSTSIFLSVVSTAMANCGTTVGRTREAAYLWPPKNWPGPKKKLRTARPFFGPKWGVGF